MEYNIFVQSEHVLFLLRLPNGCVGLEFLFSESSLHWCRNDEKYDPGLCDERAKGFQYGVEWIQHLLK
jgi:hypothetical protein